MDKGRRFPSGTCHGDLEMAQVAFDIPVDVLGHTGPPKAVTEEREGLLAAWIPERCELNP